MKVRPALIIAENNHILFMEYQYGNATVYNLPGGNTDTSETLPQTIRRELQEELQVIVEVQNMLLLGEVMQTSAKQDVLHVLFEGKVIEGTPTINPAETSARAVVWLPIEALHSLNLYPNVGNLLKKIFLERLPITPYIGKIDQQWF